MDSENQKQDWREEDYTSDELKTVWLVGGGILILLIGIVIGAVFFAGDEPVIEDTYWLNLATTGLGFAATVLVLNTLTARREIRRLKDRLVHEAGSQSNERAKAAVDDLRHYGWLVGKYGLLKGEYLSVANLQGAQLTEVNLEQTDLTEAQLQNSRLMHANLRYADLHDAKLSGAYLISANMENATLSYADLSDAILWNANLNSATLQSAELTTADLANANLIGADLSFANLHQAKFRNANLTGATFSTDTIMPDGQNWYEGMDLERYTNPDHPDFFAVN